MSLRSMTWVATGVVLLACLVILFPYLEPLPRKPLTAEWPCHRHVAHALGVWRGQPYTNSLEAFEEAYRTGFRAFELDLELTTDGVLVATHDWVDGPVTLEEFRRAAAASGFTPMTFEEVVPLVSARDDVYVILDTKGDPLAVWDEVDRVLVGSGADLRARIIPQLYTPTAREVRATAGFPRVLLTLYKTAAPDWVLLRYLDHTGISAVTMAPGRWSPELAGELDRRGVAVYVHTVNEVEAARAWFGRGVWGIYTDSLFTPETGIEDCRIPAPTGGGRGRD